MGEVHAFSVDGESVAEEVDIRTVREGLVLLHVPDEVEVAGGSLKTSGGLRLRELTDREELQTMLFDFLRGTTDKLKLKYAKKWGFPEGGMEISLQTMEDHRQLMAYALAIAEALRERNEDRLFGQEGFFVFEECQTQMGTFGWRLTWDRPAFEDKAVVSSTINSKTGERSSNSESVSVLCEQPEERFDAVAYILTAYLVNPRARVRARLMQGAGGIHIQLVPESHLAALWFAVMRSISGEADEYRVCPVCGRSFPMHVWVDKPSGEKKRLRAMTWNGKTDSWECFLCRKAREERNRKRRREEERAREVKASSGKGKK